MDPEVITNRSGAIRGGEDRAYPARLARSHQRPLSPRADVP